MIKLNLTANDSQQKIILEHLTPLISDVLAEKINNGVHVTKDNKELISKKDLNTFMEYLFEEAQKRIPEKARHGKQCVGMEGEDILSIAIHYFEEDSIHGKLFNLDGTEYVPPKPVKKTTTSTAAVASYTPPKPTPKPQLNIFDMLAGNAEPKTETEQTAQKHDKQINPIYKEYLEIQKRYPEYVIAYRLGDFYEIFGEDAEKISDDLNMTLTGKDFGLESRVPMIGIPQHAIKNYITRITECDHKLAIVESADNIRRFISQNNQTVEIDTGEILSDNSEDIEELSVEEMRQFDGDLSETEELMTVSKLIGESPVENNADENNIPDLLNMPAEPILPNISDDDFDMEKERQKMKAFDLEAMIILQELFDDKITIA